MGLGDRGIEGDRVPVPRDGGVGLAGRFGKSAEGDNGAYVVGIDRQRRPVAVLRIAVAPGLGEGVAEIEVALRCAGVELDGAAKACLGVVEPARRPECRAQRVVDLGIVGLALGGPGQGVRSGGGIAVHQMDDAEEMQRVGLIGDRLQDLAAMRRRVREPALAVARKGMLQCPLKLGGGSSGIVHR